MSNFVLWSNYIDVVLPLPCELLFSVIKALVGWNNCWYQALAWLILWDDPSVCDWHQLVLVKGKRKAGKGEGEHRELHRRKGSFTKPGLCWNQATTRCKGEAEVHSLSWLLVLQRCGMSFITSCDHHMQGSSHVMHPSCVPPTPPLFLSCCAPDLWCPLVAPFPHSCRESMSRTNMQTRTERLHAGSVILTCTYPFLNSLKEYLTEKLSCQHYIYTLRFKGGFVVIAGLSKYRYFVAYSLEWTFFWS